MRTKPKKSRFGFTLIEVLVATFILVVIVMILSKVFHQASVAWSAGFRRADGNMTGRSAVGFMARELMNACADDQRIFIGVDGTQIWDSQQAIQFVTLTGETGSDERAARWITYKHASKGDLRRIEKRSDPNDYGKWKDYSDWTLVTNVESIFFYTPGGSNYVNGKLPAWVRMRLTLDRSDDVSGVGATSAGPDGKFGTDDDLRSGWVEND
jgi:prepilin-type N-terminal cleavage/methylation domain-containing protein